MIKEEKIRVFSENGIQEDEMINWKNLDELSSFKELESAERVCLPEVMAGEGGAERVKKYCAPMAEGLAYNYAAKSVDDSILASLAKLADEAQLLINSQHFTMAKLSIPVRSVLYCISSAADSSVMMSSQTA